MENANKMQSIINDDLFPTVTNVSDVKQVLEFMENVAQPISQKQVRALILLQAMGDNERLHGKQNPYKPIIDKITKDFKKAVAPTGVYLETMEQLIPKPPKPIIMAEKVEKGGK